MRVRADEMQILEEIRVGDIGAIIGCKNIRSGDTLLDELSTTKVQLSGVTMPPPVFFCSIEAEMSRDKQQLETILFNLSREDPSIHVNEDDETGQLLVSGLGELHLEVLRDRIEIEYGLKATLGKMRVAYRESISESGEQEIELQKTIGGAHMYCKLLIRVESTIEEIDAAEIQRQKFERLQEDELNPTGTVDAPEDFTSNLGENTVTFDFHDLEPVTERVKLEGDEYEKSRSRRNRDELTASAAMEVYRSLDSLPLEHQMTLKEAIEDSLLCGQLLGYPMVNTRVRVLDGRWSNIRSKSPLIF